MNTLNATLPPFQRAICKGHLVSTGIDIRDLDRPLIGVVNSWNEIVPGHVHLREVAAWVKKGILAAGAYPLEFNTIAVCDGIAQGHAGMRYSLPSRELIADSIELMVRAHGIFDGLVFIASCDKIVPAMLMAAARLNIPSLLVPGGPMVPCITPRESKAARQAFLRGELDEEALVARTREYYPGPGACPFLGTANTMMMLAEALGFTLPDMALTPAASAAAYDLARQSGEQVVRLVAAGIRPRDILTRPAFLNALTVLSATGASLNSVLHLPAIAAEAGVELTLTDFEAVSERTPFLVAVTPNDAEHTVADIHRAGGLPALLHVLLPLLTGNASTVTGKSLAENVAGRKVKNPALIHSLDDPLAPSGGIAVLSGTLAPGGAVVKPSAVAAADQVFSGPARVFNSQEEALAAAEAGRIQSGDVVVVRYEGPRGGPGMRELHRLTEVLALVPHTAIVTDGRFSGASGGLAVGYVSPEAAGGGPLALVAEGDRISIDIPQRRLDLVVPAEELARRSASFTPPSRKLSGCLALYAAHVGEAAQGAVRRL
ncbi:MAG TPA: dihydroxy-acid dehydratase [Firmicutes bacterium]|nr:dihydroxy-acid dehydratase [Bacillota bacterium]